MAEERVQRRLAAILAADVVGYSRLMEQDEALRKESQTIQQRLQQEKALVESEKKAAEAEVTKDREILAEAGRAGDHFEISVSFPSARQLLLASG